MDFNLLINTTFRAHYKSVKCRYVKYVIDFSSNTTLKRHNESFHTLERATYQCWHCNTIDARKKKVLNHLLQKHGDTEKKYIIVDTKNKKNQTSYLETKTVYTPTRSRTKRDNIPTQHTDIVHPLDRTSY